MKKEILILGNINVGSLSTSLKSNDYNVKIKLPHSSAKNWESICDILEDDNNNDLIIIGKFTETTLSLMTDWNYEDIVSRFFELVKRKRHMFFIYKDNYFFKFNYITDYPWINRRLRKLDKDDKKEEKLEALIRYMFENDVNILPYEKHIDIEISGQAFIENTIGGLIFKIYIPNEKIWSAEFNRFINLFKDYASNVAKIDIKIIENKTNMGVTCSLFTSVTSPVVNIENLFKEFSTFMDLCANNPQEAEKFMRDLKIPDNRASQILYKYIKESQRLLIDIKHEKEIKLLQIRHRFENELQEDLMDNNITEYLAGKFSKTSSLDSYFLTSASSITNQTININPIIVEKMDAIVASEINGNITFNEAETQLFSLIEKYAPNDYERAALESALYELKDEELNKEQKRSAWQKLYGFVGKVADKASDIGVALLTKYLEGKLNL